MNQLSKECPVLRPFYGFMVPRGNAPANGLHIAGATQMVQSFEVQQLNANHHELRVAPEGYGDTDGVMSMYCIYCAHIAPAYFWQKLQSGVEAGA